MANQRTARLLSAQDIGTNARLLEFALEDELGFTGGQYIIVHTGIPLGDGKTAKRAYSLLSSDAQQTRFQIAVKRIGAGPGSNFMCDLPVGAELSFSGPWGKFLPRDFHSSEFHSSVEAPAATLLLATDTGITAAMGLVGSQKFRPYRNDAKVFWLSGPQEYFLAEAFVRERIDGLCRDFQTIRIPMDSAERQQWFERNRDTVLRQVLHDRPATAFLSGDGFLLAEFRDALQQMEPQAPEILIETFFHHQELKSTVKAPLA